MEIYERKKCKRCIEGVCACVRARVCVRACVRSLAKEHKHWVIPIGVSIIFIFSCN